MALVAKEERAECTQREVRERGRAPARRGGLVACLGLTGGASAGVWAPGGARGLSLVGHEPELKLCSI
jgi:hypothetical protein